MRARNWLLTAAWLISLSATGTVAYLSAKPSTSEPPVAVDATAADDDFAATEAADAAEIERLKTSLAKVESRLERTEAMLTRLSSVLETLAGNQSGNGSINGANTAVKSKALTSAQIEQINRRLREKDAERLSDDFQTQASDSTWSPQTAALIAERLSNNQELPSVDLIANECRESLCRIEVVVADTEQKLQFEEKLPLLLGETLPRTTMFDDPQPDGSIRSIIYLGRDNG